MSKKTSKEVDEELKAQIDNLHCKEPIYFSKEFINFVNFTKELINNE
ncbi:MAG: hypothetical protein GX682_01355 [Clostridiaceae bacterium]|nr:hypothetical protein [Clostridiaceae bacterium]